MNFNLQAAELAIQQKLTGPEGKRLVQVGITATAIAVVAALPVIGEIINIPGPGPVLEGQALISNLASNIAASAIWEKIKSFVAKAEPKAESITPELVQIWMNSVPEFEKIAREFSHKIELERIAWNAFRVEDRQWLEGLLRAEGLEIDKLKQQGEMTVGRLDEIKGLLTQALTSHALTSRNAIENFLTRYVGSKGFRQPFGGRDADLAMLDNWLKDSSAPQYALLTAPAGRGKSALISHWVVRLVADDRAAPHVIFYPVSARFDLNSKSTVFKTLAVLAADLHGERVVQFENFESYRARFHELLTTPPVDGRQVLVVLDSLDEAAGWGAGPDLFPALPPAHLRVLVTARTRAEHFDGADWLAQLEWQRHAFAHKFSLGPLSEEGVRQVLVSMGNPLDALGSREEIVSKLYRVTTGDPVMVGLYVDALLPRGAQLAIMQPEELDSIKPGIEAFFKQWFEQQKRLWQSAVPSEDVSRNQAVNALLDVCALALGPLSQDDVVAICRIAPEISVTHHQLRWAAEQLNRFVQGDGDKAGGYIFSHPRLAQFFRSRLSNRERIQWQQRFVQYGRETLASLNAGTLKENEASPYVIRNFGAHLHDVAAAADDFYALMSEGWLRAWRVLDDTDGFLADCDLAIEAAKKQGTAGLGYAAFGALCHESVRSEGSGIPSALLAACVGLSPPLMSPAAALSLAHKKATAAERAEALVALCETLPAQTTLLREAFHLLRFAELIDEERVFAAFQRVPELRSDFVLAASLNSSQCTRVRMLSSLLQYAPELHEDVMRVACNIDDDSTKAEVFLAIAQHAPELSPELLEAVNQLKDPFARARCWSELVRWAPKLARVALYAAQQISNDANRTWMLAKLARYLPALRIEVLRAAQSMNSDIVSSEVLSELAKFAPELRNEVLHATRQLSDDAIKAKVLLDLVEHAPELRGEVLRVARHFGNDSIYSQVLLQLVKCAPELRGELLQVANQIMDDLSRAKVIAGLAEHTLELREEALKATWQIKDDALRAHALLRLAERVPELRENVLQIVRQISDVATRAKVLIELAKHTPELRREALQAARHIGDDSARISLLVFLAQYGPDLRSEVLHEARTCDDKYDRAWLLSALVLLTPEFLQETLAAVRKVDDAGDRARLLSALAMRAPEVTDEALEVARQVSNDSDRAWILTLLAHRAPELRAEALLAARQISRDVSRAQALVRLAEYMLDVRNEALEATRQIMNISDRARVLSLLARHMPELLEEAAQVARQIASTAERIEVMSTLVRSSPELLEEVVNSARQVENDFVRAQVLSGLAKHSPAFRDEALFAARQIRDDVSRAQVLSTLVLHVPALPELFNALDIMQALKRESAYEVLESILPHIHEYGGEAAIKVVSRAIRETARWWP